MSSFSKTGSILALAGALAGCSKPQGEATAPAAYKEIDLNTYLIDATYSDGGTLSKNLAKFRSEVSGDFVLILNDARNTLSEDVLAVRPVAVTGTVTNRLVGIIGGAGAAK